MYVHNLYEAEHFELKKKAKLATKKRGGGTGTGTPLIKKKQTLPPSFEISKARNIYLNIFLKGKIR